MRVYDVATEFTPYPFGRYAAHGSYNGERFRTEILLPILRGGERVVVDLSNTRGAAASFLEEAFGGLLRSGLTIAQIRALLEIRSDKDPSLITEIETYMSQQALRDEGAPH